MSRALERLQRRLEEEVVLRRRRLLEAGAALRRQELLQVQLLGDRDHLEDEVRRRLGDGDSPPSFGLERMRQLLERAIDGNRRRLHAGREEQERAAAAVRDARARSRATERLLERREDVARREHDRRQRNRLDEAATRGWLRKGGETR